MIFFIKVCSTYGYSLYCKKYFDLTFTSKANSNYFIKHRFHTYMQTDICA